MLSVLEILPQGTLVVFFGFLIFFGIIYWVYRTSEYFSKKRFFQLMAALIIIELTVITLLFVSRKTYQDKTRLAILPFQDFSLNEKEKWISWAIADLVEQSIPQDSTCSYFFYRNDQIRKIVNFDSIGFSEYRNRFSSALKLDFYLSASIKKQATEFQLEYKIFNVNEGQIYSKIINFKEIDIISSLGLNIAREYLQKVLKKNDQKLQKNNDITESSLQKYFIAKRYLFNNKFDSSEINLKQSLEDDSKNIEAWISLSDLLLREANLEKNEGKIAPIVLDETEKGLKSARKLDSSNVQIYQKLAKFYILKEKWDLAQKNLQKAHWLNPASPETYLYFSQLHPSRYRSLGFQDEEELLKYALFLNPGYVDAAISLSKYYTDYLQDNRSAIEVVENIIAINSEQIDALMELGKLYISYNQTIKIIHIFEKIIQKDPMNSSAFYNLGIYYYNLKDLDNALKLFERAVKIDDHPDAHLYAAYIYEMMSSAEKDSAQRQNYLDKAITHLRYRVKHNRGKDDPYAETARKHLYEIFH